MGCEAAPKPAISIFLIHRKFHIYDCYAAERGGAVFRQAPSPQVRGLLAQLPQLIRLDNSDPVLLFQCQAPHRTSQLAGFDTMVFTRDQPR